MYNIVKKIVFGACLALVSLGIYSCSEPNNSIASDEQDAVGLFSSPQIQSLRQFFSHVDTNNVRGILFFNQYKYNKY